PLSGAARVHGRRHVGRGECGARGDEISNARIRRFGAHREKDRGQRTRTTISAAREEPMQRIMRAVLMVAIALFPAVTFAQAPKAATYITDEEVKTVNSQPGIDRTIKVVDIGNEHLSIGIIHRGPSGGAGRGAAAGGGAGRAAPAPAEPCGE